MARNFEVAVIGGGVIGLSIAEAAARRDMAVIVIEADRVGRAASYANAGLIVPSFSLPLANPNSIKGLPDLLWGEDKSLSLRLRVDFGFLRWTLAFLGASRRDKMLRTAAVVSRLAQQSLSTFEKWDPTGEQFGFEQHGWLHLYESEPGWRTGQEEAELLRGLGTRVESLDPAASGELEPNLPAEIVGALYYPEEAQLDPYELCTWLAERALQSGVQIHEGSAATNLATADQRIIGVQLADETIRADYVVVAAGAWSGRMVRPLIGWLPLEPAKGYSLTYSAPASKPNRPLMWAEKHVVMSPFADRLRLTTGLDLVGFDDELDPEMIVKLGRTAEQWMGEKAADGSGEPWFGYRPLTPDGLPILGPTAKYSNLFLATGHGQLGVTLAPASGEMVAAQLTGEDPGPEAVPVSPIRFGL